MTTKEKAAVNPAAFGFIDAASQYYFSEVEM